MANSKADSEFEALLGDFLPGSPRPLQKLAAPTPKKQPPATPPGPPPVVAPPPQWTADLAAREAEIAGLRAQLDAALAEAQAARATAQAALPRAIAAAAALDAAQAAAREVDADRRVQARRVTELQQQLAAAQKLWANADRRFLPTTRGLQGDEPTRAVLLMLETHGAEALDALLDRDPSASARLFERLVLSCGADPCTPRHPGTLVLKVDRDRCEVCAGSDSRQAFSAFRQAVRAAGFTRCTVVGGSPAYREMLRELERTLSDGLELRYVEDVAPKADQRARQVRGLVIIWGATAVDHAATSHYRDAGDKVLEIPHRGIGGMLRKAAAELQRGRR